MTVRTVDNIRRPDTEPSSTYSDSGVVTSTCGGLRRLCCRSFRGVSPVRTAVRMSTSGSCSATSSRRMPASGASRLSRMSLDSAFRGEIYTTLVASASPSGCRPWRTRASSAARKAVSVLPDPVGAATSVSRPAWMAGQAARCAGVGAAKAWRNQAETAGWKSASGTRLMLSATPRALLTRRGLARAIYGQSRAWYRSVMAGEDRASPARAAAAWHRHGARAGAGR